MLEGVRAACRKAAVPIGDERFVYCAVRAVVFRDPSARRDVDAQVLAAPRADIHSAVGGAGRRAAGRKRRQSHDHHDAHRSAHRSHPSVLILGSSRLICSPLATYHCVMEYGEWNDC